MGDASASKKFRSAMRQRTVYAAIRKRRKAGEPICTCGKPVMEGRKRCEACVMKGRKASAKSHKRSHAARRMLGLCIVGGCESEAVECASRCGYHQELYNEVCKVRRDRLKAEGLCRDCMCKVEPVVSKKGVSRVPVRCTACAKRHAEGITSKPRRRGNRILPVASVAASAKRG